ncbi:MAG: trypsin-like peptidase domain-containing protein, partial [Pseudomonadota bacterium]
MLFACFITTQAQARELPDFTTMVEQYSPAVVNISTTTEVRPRSNRRFREMPDDLPFRDFFRRYFEEQQNNGDDNSNEDNDPNRPRERRNNSLGSGFIISADGYVVTNNHVIDGADEIIVRLKDRRELEAKLIGADERSDLALLKVKAKDLPFVEFGSSEKLKVGSWVLAIGSPFGFDHSVTAGIVSAKGRSLPGADNNYVPFIQTDVAINPGNSGCCSHYNRKTGQLLPSSRFVTVKGT